MARAQQIAKMNSDKIQEERDNLLQIQEQDNELLSYMVELAFVPLHCGLAEKLKPQGLGANQVDI